MSKVIGSLEEVLELVGIEDGMTVSFNHHLRDGDYVSPMVMEAIAKKGLKDMTVAISAILNPANSFIPLIEDGVITQIDTNGSKGLLPTFASEGKMEKPFVFRTHGGRARAIESGDLKIDVAFIAASSSDMQGNCNGLYGPSAFGSLGYSMPDAEYADKVVVVTDYLVDYPNSWISIPETKVDYVVVVDSLGDPEKIVSHTTVITKDPIKLHIAKKAAKAIYASGLIKDGFSFQTGAGGVSLAVAQFIRDYMVKDEVVGSFIMGGITKYLVDLLEEGLFKSILDVQCFDLEAVRSIKENPNHMEISASQYANIEARSCAVDQLDVVVLGATEIDLDFNVNVHTDSNGMIMGGSGGHSDTADGAKMTLIVAPLIRGRLPIVVDKVKTVSTPGSSVDVLVTERGIAINPLRQDLITQFKKAGVEIMDISELQALAEKRVGKPEPIQYGDKVVAEVIYRDGTVIDRIKQAI